MAQQLREVFTAGGLPSVTYVSRDHLELETKILDSLARGFSFNVVTGPTKSGKTVLCRKVLEGRSPVVIEGGQIKTEAEFWEHVAYQLNIAATATKGRSEESDLSTKAEAGGSLFGLIDAKTGLEQKTSDSRTSSLTYNNVQILAAIDRLLEQKKALLVDDFHYIDPAIQRSIIRSLKAAVFKGLPVFLLAVPHRAFDPVTVENEVEGRFRHISIPRWSLDDLLLIPQSGFAELNLAVDRQTQRQICEASFGNPLLVQEICAEFCLKNRIRERSAQEQKLSGELLEGTYKEMAESKGFPSYQRLGSGSKVNQKINLLEMAGGGTEDLHTAVIAAIARLGPKGETKIEEILASLSSLVSPDAQPPSTVEVKGVLVAISRAAKDAATGEPPIEWMDQEEKLVIIDPFLSFYLRWTFKGQAAISDTSK